MNFPTRANATKQCGYCGLYHYATAADATEAIRKVCETVELCGRSRAHQFLTPERPDLLEPKQ